MRRERDREAAHQHVEARAPVHPRLPTAVPTPGQMVPSRTAGPHTLAGLSLMPESAQEKRAAVRRSVEVAAQCAGEDREVSMRLARLLPSWSCSPGCYRGRPGYTQPPTG